MVTFPRMPIYIMAIVAHSVDTVAIDTASPVFAAFVVTAELGIRITFVYAIAQTIAF